MTKYANFHRQSKVGKSKARKFIKVENTFDVAKEWNVAKLTYKYWWAGEKFLLAMNLCEI